MLDIAIARNCVGRTTLYYALTHSGPQNFAILDIAMKHCSSSLPFQDNVNLSSNSGETPLGLKLGIRLGFKLGLGYVLGLDK
eukprot:12531532-Ditylum_brightwellii.AAC.1